MILPRKFYERDTLVVARELLGKLLVHKTAEGTTIGQIVEAEAYIGPEDKASHAYNNRRTARTEVQFGPKGHAYVYQIYGIYYCFDATGGPIVGKPEAVLIRALEPEDGKQVDDGDVVETKRINVEYAGKVDSSTVEILHKGQ